MKQSLKDFGWVVLLAVLVCMPSAVMIAPDTPVPFWYGALAAIAGALGIGLIAILFGVITLVARRNHPHGRRRPALIVTAIVAAFTAFAAVYPLLRA